MKRDPGGFGTTVPKQSQPGAPAACGDSRGLGAFELPADRNGGDGRAVRLRFVERSGSVMGNCFGTEVPKPSRALTLTGLLFACDS